MAFTSSSSLMQLLLLISCLPAAVFSVDVVNIGVVFPFQTNFLNVSARRVLDYTVADIQNDPVFRTPEVEFRLIYRDSNLSPQVAVQRTLELVNNNAVPALVAEYTSGLSSPVALVTGSLGVFQCSGSAANITILRNEAYNPDDVDYKLQVSSIKSSDARIIVVIGYDVDVIKMLREAKAQGIVSPRHVWIGTDGVIPMYALLNGKNTLGISNHNVTKNKQKPKQSDKTTRDGYTDEDRKNTEGMLFVSPNERGGVEWDDLRTRYSNQYGEDPQPFAYFYRDCLLAIALGFKKMIQRGISVQQILGRRTGVSLAEFTNTQFTGASGKVVFDQNGDRAPNYILSNIVNGALIESLNIDGTGAIKVTKPVVFPGGSLVAPPDGQILWREVLGTTSIIGFAIIAFSGLGMLASVVASIIIVLNRHTAPVKQMSLPFSLIKSLGIILVYSSMLSWLGNFEENGACYAQQWVGWVGFSLVMQGILPKCWRVFRIFENTRMKTMRYLKDPFLLSLSIIITAINIAIIGVWSGISPLSPLMITDTAAGVFHYECRSKSNNAQNIFNIILMSYNGGLLLAAIALAWACRNAHSAYRETNFILYSAQNILISSIVVIGLVYGIPNGAYLAILYLRIVFTWVVTTFLLMATVGRVAFMSLVAKDSMFKRSSRKQSWGDSGPGSNDMRVTSRSKSDDDGEGFDHNERVVVNGYGQMEMTVPVKDGNRALSPWLKKRVIFNPISRSLGIVQEDSLIGEMLVINNTVTIVESINFEDCVEVRYGSKVKILQFSSPQTLEKFLEITGPALKVMPGQLHHGKSLMRHESSSALQHAFSSPSSQPQSSSSVAMPPQALANVSPGSVTSSLSHKGW
ncbi:Gamma-aminobutyric acid type B receptor subunit 1 [Phlyctochytrium planicorne]|nr:Gamma-aminobutyric acid type B receptor subunit 1 [Phlyctochytrium planicorne]